MKQPEAGQVWADNDRRAAGREIQIVSINGDYARCVVIAESPAENAHRRYVAPRPVGWSAVGHRTRIALSRFKPSSTGYRFVR